MLRIYGSPLLNGRKMVKHTENFFFLKRKVMRVFTELKNATIHDIGYTILKSSVNNFS